MLIDPLVFPKLIPFLQIGDVCNTTTGDIAQLDRHGVNGDETRLVRYNQLEDMRIGCCVYITTSMFDPMLMALAVDYGLVMTLPTGSAAR